MAKYAVDFSGWIYVDAENDGAAINAASEILSVALPYEFHGGDWEIENVEVTG